MCASLRKEATADTAKALEPAVQRILDRQRSEMERMKEEPDSLPEASLRVSVLTSLRDMLANSHV